MRMLLPRSHVPPLAQPLQPGSEWEKVSHFADAVSSYNILQVTLEQQPCAMCKQPLGLLCGRT